MTTLKRKSMIHGENGIKRKFTETKYSLGNNFQHKESNGRKQIICKHIKEY